MAYEVEFQSWSQEKRTYRGNHDRFEEVCLLEVHDVLQAMYELNVELNDENLEKVLQRVDDEMWLAVHNKLEEIIESMNLGREER